MRMKHFVSHSETLCFERLKHFVSCNETFLVAICSSLDSSNEL